MSSIVKQLQEEASDSEIKITDLLRKALIVAKKLKITKFEGWISMELNGYLDHWDEIPRYRWVSGELKGWHPYQGWLPVIMPTVELTEKVNSSKLNTGIAEIEELSKSDGSELQMYLPATLEDLLNRDMPGGPTTYRLFFGRMQTVGVLDAVRNKVLHWALTLEEDGILGDGIDFSQREKNIAADTHYHLNIQGSVANSQLQMGSPKGMQTQKSGLDVEQLKEIIGLIVQNQEKVGVDVSKEVGEIQDELIKPLPDQTILKKAVDGLVGILSSASGNLIAQGILYQLTTL